MAPYRDTHSHGCLPAGSRPSPADPAGHFVLVEGMTMRHLRLRMTTRQLMVMIALLAVVMAVVVGPRWRICSREISYHLSEEQLLLRSSDSLAASGLGAARRGEQVEATVSSGLAAAFRQKAAEHAHSRRLWERARWLPWTSLPPVGARRESHGVWP
jgi:hypothetical protein